MGKGLSILKAHARRIIGGAVILTLAVAMFLGNIFTSRGPVEASADTYYPTFCLGGWENPKLASEKPVINPKDLGAFTPQNSAFLAEDVSAQIFCGYFPVVGRDKLPLSARVSFSWLFVGEPIPPVEEVPVAPEEEAVPPEEGASPAEGEPLPNPEESGDVLGEETSVTPEADPASTPEPSQESESTPTESSSESSGGGESSDGGSEGGDSSGGDSGGDSGGGGGDGGGGDSGASAYLSKTLALFLKSRASYALAEGSFSANDLLEVSYSFDGVRWTSAGRVGKDNWRDFAIQIPATSWQELQNLQVMVTALPSIDKRPAIYLESMQLRVSVDRTFTELAGDSIAAVGDVFEGLFTPPAPVPVPVAAPAYVAPPAKEKRLSFRVAGSPIDSLMGRNLPTPDVSASGDGLSLTVKGKCSKPYFVVMTYRSREDFLERPRQFASNYAGKCEGGSFSYDMEHLPVDTPEDVYYLVVGEQDDEHPWQPTTELVPIEMRTVEVTPGTLDE